LAAKDGAAFTKASFRFMAFSPSIRVIRVIRGSFSAFSAAKSLPRLLFLFLRQMHIIHPVAGELTTRPEPPKFPFIPLRLFARSLSNLMLGRPAL
jgi:hypothetical protein